ncbi:MAG: DUF1592 domain-containing protein [Lentisphaeraceae bacterium]|nr:DUF1592 domain-containing protein [Lentisphaeraceae bacterium]
MIKVWLTITLFSFSCFAEDFGKEVNGFLGKYCISCHGPKKQKSDVRVDTLSTKIEDAETAEHWQHILDELNGNTMPPEDEPQPTTKELSQVLETLTFAIDKAKKKLEGKNSEVVLSRLNQREYINTIKSLTGVTLSTVDVPLDNKTSNYDTNGKGLSLSPYQFESYLALAQKALLEGTFPQERPQVKTQVFQPEIRRNKSVSKSIKKLETKKKLIRNDEMDLRAYKAYQKTKGQKDGALVAPNFVSSGSKRFFSTLGFSAIPSKSFQKGTYKLFITCATSENLKDGKALLNLDFNYRQKTSKDIIDYHEVKGTLKKPQTIEISLYLNQAQSFVIDSLITSKSAEKHYVWIDKIKVTGPHYDSWPPKSHLKIFPVAQEEMPELEYAKLILGKFLLNSLNGHTSTSEFKSLLLNNFTESRKMGKTVKESIISSMAIILSSPKFLYKIERSTTAKTVISDRELANRLSYLLWSSSPDKELESLANANKLNDKGTLRSQIIRMIKDPKSIALAKGFVPQWLDLDKFDEVDVNKRKFPLYNDTVGRFLKEEPSHFFHTLMTKNLSLRNFIDSDFIVVNNLLQSYYSLPLTAQKEFEKYKLPKNSPRGGLLGMAAIQIMTGNGERTSPVLRGTFVLSKIIGTPSPEPPPNVPQLESKKTKSLSIRDALKLHQAQPQCSSCHKRIDPLGFGLENFDAAGIFHPTQTTPRKKRKKGRSIDTIGHLPNGEKYTSLTDYKTKLMSYQHQFSRSFIESFLEYALGRSVGFADSSLIDDLQATSLKQNYQLQDLIIDIATRPEFRIK